MVEEDSEELIGGDFIDDDLEDLSEKFRMNSRGPEQETSSSTSDVDNLMETADGLYSSGQVQAALDVLNQVLERTHPYGCLGKMGLWALQETPTPAFQSSTGPVCNFSFTPPILLSLTHSLQWI